jgi:branched-chain amino acid transport system ATP-binding protein
LPEPGVKNRSADRFICKGRRRGGAAAMSSAEIDIHLEVKNVSLSSMGVKAISDFSFKVKRGETCALIGPNGAGKSSVLNILNGVYQASSGEIVLNGIHLRNLTPVQAAESGIGRMFQNNALFPKMTVLNNVMTGLSRKSNVTALEHAFRLPRSVRQEGAFREKSLETIKFLGLHEYREAVVEGLPYGIQKRVGLARALVSEPEILLLDEPMAGMNREEKKEMSRLILAIPKHLAVTIVLIEHDIEVVTDLADHVVVLDYGRKLADGIPDDVMKDSNVIAAYLGTAH